MTPVRILPLILMFLLVLVAASVPSPAMQDADGESIRALFLEGKVDEAQEAALAHLEAQPDDIEVRITLANCYRSRSRLAPEGISSPEVPSRLEWINRSATELRTVLEASPLRRDVWLGMCQLAQEADDLDGLARCVGDAARKLPDDWRFAESLKQLGAPYVKEKQYGDAVRLFDILAEVYDSHVPTLLVTGRARFLIGRREEGLAAVDRAVELKPGDATVHEQRADLAVFDGDFKLAATHYNRVTQIEPFNPYPYIKAVAAAHAVSRVDGIRAARSAHNRWTALPEKISGEFPFAELRRMRELVEKGGASGMDVYQMARTFASSNAWPEALSELAAAIAIDRGMAEAYYLRGQVQSQLGMHHAAVASYDETVTAIESQPARQLGVSRDEALASLCESRAYAGDEKGSLEALAKIEDMVTHALQIGIAHDLLGRHEEAAGWFARVISNSTNPEHLVEAQRYLESPPYRSLRPGS